MATNRNVKMYNRRENDDYLFREWKIVHNCCDKPLDYRRRIIICERSKKIKSWHRFRFFWVLLILFLLFLLLLAPFVFFFLTEGLSKKDNDLWARYRSPKVMGNNVNEPIKRDEYFPRFKDSESTQIAHIYRDGKRYQPQYPGFSTWKKKGAGGWGSNKTTTPAREFPFDLPRGTGKVTPFKISELADRLPYINGALWENMTETISKFFNIPPGTPSPKDPTQMYYNCQGKWYPHPCHDEDGMEFISNTAEWNFTTKYLLDFLRNVVKVPDPEK